MTSFVGESEDQPTFFEGAVYWERPIESATSLVATTWSSSDPATPTLTRHEIAAGVKRVVFDNDAWVLAAQGAAVWVSEALPECQEGGGEVRLLAGRSLAGGRAFLNAEAAARDFSGCGNLRFDLTGGIRPAQNWLALGQIFYDAPSEGDEVVRAQLSVVRFLDSGRGIQLGVRARIDGGEQEAAFVLGLWSPPVD